MVSIRLHYDSDKKACWPFAISQKIGVGRCLVASRDISPGELILYDASVTSGPRQGKVLIYKSPEQLFIMIYLGRGQNFLLLLGSYYTYWSYYMYCLIFFLIESIISMYWVFYYYTTRNIAKGWTKGLQNFGFGLGSGCDWYVKYCLTQRLF